jgi:hypothetical protein
MHVPRSKKFDINYSLGNMDETTDLVSLLMASEAGFDDQDAFD